MRKVDDYEYDLHKLCEDINPVIQTSFKVMAKTQSVLDCSPYWRGLRPFRAWKPQRRCPSGESPKGTIQGRSGGSCSKGRKGSADSVLAVYDEALEQSCGAEACLCEARHAGNRSGGVLCASPRRADCPTSKTSRTVWDCARHAEKGREACSVQFFFKYHVFKGFSRGRFVNPRHADRRERYCVK